MPLSVAVACKAILTALLLTITCPTSSLAWTHGGGSPAPNPCASAPAPAAAAGFCTETWKVNGATSDWTTTNVDTALTYPSGKKLYIDDCFGQTPITTNLTLNATSATVGDNSGGYQANLASATCKGQTFVGTSFGGGGYFQVTSSWTAASVAGDWQAGWLWGLECTTATAMPACNWTGQQTNFGIASASYVSGTGVLTVTPTGSTTLTQFGSVILTSLTGTGGFAVLQGTTCYVPNAVSGSGSFTLNCNTGAGTSALTGGNVGMVYDTFSEFDDFEMFMGNFGDSLNQWQQTDHAWSKPDRSGNYFRFLLNNPGQSSFSSPHTYALLWKVATASSPGSACSYYDGTLAGCQTWTQFVNNGAQAPPVNYAISSGSYVSGTGQITLNLSTTASFTIGSSVTVSGIDGRLNGSWTVLSGTSGSTLIVQGPTGQGTITTSFPGGLVAQSWAFGAADGQHFIFYHGCSNPNPCTTTLMDAWQTDATHNLVQ